MANLTAVPDPVHDQNAESDDKPKPDAARPRTSRPLPTDRIAFARQLAILRAFAVAAAEGDGFASANDAERVAKMSHTTISLATPFFADSGLLIRSDRGRFKPSEAVIEYTRGQEWSPDSAGRYLRPVVSKSWFGEIIAAKVKLGSRETDDIMAALAGASGASPEHKGQIDMLIDYAVLGGLVRRDGSMLRRVDGTSAPIADTEADALVEQQVPAQSPASKDGVRTAFAKDPTEGYVEFHVNVKVRTAEFSTWRPERITAFFGGIAQVLAAKGRMEEDAGSSG